MTGSATAAEAALAAAEADFERGRWRSSLTAARTASADPAALVPAQRSEALRLRTLAAFRLGELDEVVVAAQTLLDQLGEHAPTYPARSRVLSVSVQAAGELARFDLALGHLQQVLSAASRGGSLEDYVRARGTAASCFALLGDPWAGQRLLSELLGLFQGLPDEAQLEARTRNNHAAVCLRIARLASEGGDPSGCAEALDHAEASLQRASELPHPTADPRFDLMAAIYVGEAALLRGEAAAVAGQLKGALAHAAVPELPGQADWLRVLLAEALTASAAPELALSLLHELDATLREGHPLGLRIRCVQQLQRASAATGAHESALAYAARARQLEQHLLYRQSQAQSRYLRTRLELEHLYRYRASASRGISSRPGALTMPVPLAVEPPAKR